MAIQLDYTNMMADVVGAAHGIEESELKAQKGSAAAIHDDLMRRHQGGELPFYDLPIDQQMLEQTLTLAGTLGAGCRDLVVLGIGGSALGTLALFRALRPLHHNLQSSEQRGGLPRLFVLDNVDPVGIAETFDLLDPTGTRFLVISKSGTTVETSSQFLLARQWLERQVGASWRDHVVLVTDPDQGSLRQLVRRDGFASCPIPPGVGGRFSVLTPVGLLPLAMVGIDIKALLAGAASMRQRTMQADAFANPAYLNALLQFLAYGKGQRISVMMPYSDQLRDVADWYRQLWAESLGKRYALDGGEVNVGPTPVKALGTTDQHSQVQLYMEGPFDKVVSFLRVEHLDRSLAMVKLPGAPELDYLDGKTLNQLIANEQQATAVALARNGRPNCTLSLDSVSAETIGELIFLFEVQTVFSGGLYRVNPLDQPGVEEGKKLTYGLMGRPGFEAIRDDLSRWQADVNRRFL